MPVSRSRIRRCIARGISREAGRQKRTPEAAAEAGAEPKRARVAPDPAPLREQVPTAGVARKTPGVVVTCQLYFEHFKAC